MPARSAKVPAPVGKCLRGRQCACAGRKNVWAAGKVHARLAKCLGWLAKCLAGWLNACAVGKCLGGWQMPGLVGNVHARLANVWVVGKVPAPVGNSGIFSRKRPSGQFLPCPWHLFRRSRHQSCQHIPA